MARKLGYTCDICKEDMRQPESVNHFFTVPIFNKKLNFKLQFLGMVKGSMLCEDENQLCLRCKDRATIEAARSLIIHYEKEMEGE